VGAGPVVVVQAASKGRMVKKSIFVFIMHHMVTVCWNAILGPVECEATFLTCRFFGVYLPPVCVPASAP
jgi:hypothetical protein